MKMPAESNEWISGCTKGI